MQKWYQHLRRRWVKGTMRFTGLFDGPKKIVTKKTAQNSPKSTIWRKNWHITLFFSNHINNEKSAQQVGLGYHEVFGLVRWPKKNSHQKNSSKQPKIDYTEQKRTYNVVFSNHISNKKSAQQVDLGYHEVFGLVRWPKKNSHQKNSSKQPKIDFKEQKMAKNILFSQKETSWYPRPTCCALFLLLI